MAKPERRNSMTLDEVSLYWRQLRKDGAPSLNKLCNSIITIDLAFEGSVSSLSKHLSKDKWTRIRSDLFDVLISSCPGYFIVYGEDQAVPLEPRSDWPAVGRVEFYPQKSNRKSDILNSAIGKIHPAIILSLRWCWAEGRNEINPMDFDAYHEAGRVDDSEEAQITRDFLDRLCDLCVDEARKSRRIAHRTWWRLSSEASSCPDKQTRNQIKKQMIELECIWGSPG
jgi:hypothetical protein